MDIKQIINLRYAMPDTSLDRLRQCLTEVSYPKGYRVLESGKVEKDIFFIKQGIVRAYTSVEGKEITFWVGKEGATLVSMKGYVNDEPGYETMELMEDSVLYVLERKKLKELFSEDLHIANWGRRYAEMELLATEERLISMLSAIASERYKELLEKEPTPRIFTVGDAPGAFERVIERPGTEPCNAAIGEEVAIEAMSSPLTTAIGAVKSFAFAEP